MRKLLLSTVAVVGFAGVASAADLPRRAAPPPLVPIAPAFTWTGFYIGVNAGAAFDTEDDDDDIFGNGGSETVRINRGDIRGSQRSAGVLRLNNLNRGGGDGLFDDDDDGDVGFTGGGQIGFNYQFTPGQGFVIGVEADIQYIDVGSGRDNRQSTTNFTFVPDNPNFGPRGPNTFGAAFDPRFQQAGGRGAAQRVVRGGSSVSSIDAFGTVRGRIGYAFDRTLIYATGGFAYGFGGGDNNDNDLFDNAGILNDGDDDDFKFGYAVGGGVEFALSNFSFFGSSAATFKIEGLYVNLEEDSNGSDGRLGRYSRVTRVLRLRDVGSSNNENEFEFAVVRAGINFKF